MVRYSKVSKARRFLGGLSLILALSSIGGCSFGVKNDDSNNQNSSYEYDMTDKNDNLNGIETPEDIEIPDDTFTQDDIEIPNEVEVQGNNGKVDVVPEDSDDLTQDNSNLTQGNDNLDMEIPNIGNYEGRSISDALRLAGYPYNYKYRKALAARLGIENYRGTAKQNLLMLELLIDYAKSLEEQVPSNEDSQTNNQDNNNNNNNNNGDHNHGDDNEKDHVFGNTLTRYEKYDDDSHYVITYLKCVDCSYSIELGRKLESHNITSTYTVHEKEDENGYDEVTYGGCADCNAVVEISRRYVKKTPVEECDHTHTHTETKYENETETTHTKVVYEICDDCGNQVGKTETIENHTYGSKKTRHEDEDENGYWLVEYEVCTGCGHEHVISRKYVSTIGCEHKYGAVQTRTTYDDVAHKDTVETYKVCSECGHEEMISTVERNHTHVDGIVTSDGKGKHQYVRTYTRSDGTTYTETIIDNCSYTNEEPVIENESETTHTYEEVIYGECDECGHRKEISRVTKYHTYEDSLVSNGDDTHSTVRTYTRSDGTTYTEIIETHNHNMVNVNISYNGNGHNQHQVIADQQCSVCHQERNGVEIRVENCTFNGTWTPCNDVEHSGQHQSTCKHCGQPIYEKCVMEDVYDENGNIIGRGCICGRYEPVETIQHNYQDTISYITIGDKKYEVYMCTLHPDCYDPNRISEHTHSFGNAIDNNDGTHSKDACACGDLGPKESHNFVYTNVVPEDNGTYYYELICDDCPATGKWGYSNVPIQDGQPYDPSNDVVETYSADEYSDSAEEEYSETTDEEVVIVAQDGEEVVVVVQDEEETIEEDLGEMDETEEIEEVEEIEETEEIVEEEPKKDVKILGLTQ